MNIILCLQKINPNIGWSVNANDYTQITCNDANTPIPTMQQLESAWAQVQAELLQEGFTRVVQAHLDSTAQLKNYDNILSATSYAGYVNDYQAEGIAYGTWRSAVWNKCYEIMADVQAGTRTVPTEAELLAELPVLVLP